MTSEVSKLTQERLELESMVDRLGRSKRLGQLLRYLGDSYLNCETEKLCEYRIATEIFGRPDTFDPTEDAIARVEAHRLRKKLREIYESEEGRHPVQITIPLGSYVPRFVYHEDVCPRSSHDSPQVFEEKLATVQDELPQTGSQASPVIASSLPQRGRALGIAAALGVVAVIGMFAFRHQQTRAAQAITTNAPPPNSPETVVAPSATNAVRILCGYVGHSRIGALNDVWGADRYFHGGQAVSSPTAFIARTNHLWLFQTARSGDFTYDIPLKPGVYELHLYFNETQYGPGLIGGEQSRTFAVRINGAAALTDFDIESDALGPNIADERVFKDVQPADDGALHLTFLRGAGPALLNALAVLPSSPHHMLPIRLIAQPSAEVDHSGNVWQPDDYHFGGQASYRRSVVTGTEDPELYSMERFGHFNYAIPVALDSRYTVKLYFAEYYFGPQASGIGGIGNRVFHVMCNGVSLLQDFDILKQTGDLHVITRTFQHLAPTAQGKLNLTFEPVHNYASVSAIEILDESP